MAWPSGREFHETKGFKQPLQKVSVLKEALVKN